ncbi:MAG: DUF393 domain-containing protein [Cyanobacteria bacterium SZAS LIN-3]|nr:DUF393 domain-containing protein [Cyanobacteria bacterium SZAS LIN-3]
MGTDTTTEIILYDGVCGLCNRFIKIVVDRDPRQHFQFASLQGDLAASILKSMGKDPALLKSIYLVSGYGTGTVTLKAKAEAAVAIFGKLEGPIHFLKYLRFIPLPILNLGYDIVASNRYRIFGRLDACPMPKPGDLERFLDHKSPEPQA